MSTSPFETADEYVGPENKPLVKYSFPGDLPDAEFNLLLGSPTAFPTPDSPEGRNDQNRLIFYNKWRSTLIGGRVNNLNLVTGEEALQQWNPGICSQYSLAWGWNQTPYGGKYSSLNTKGDQAKGQGMLGYGNRGAAQFAQTFGQWNINICTNGGILGKANYQGRQFYPWSGASGRNITVIGDVTGKFPVGEMLFIRRGDSENVVFDPWHALVVSTSFSGGFTTVTLDRTIVELVGIGGLVCNAEPISTGEPSPHKNQFIIGTECSNSEDYQMAFGYQACPPGPNVGMVAEAAGMFSTIGDAQTLRATLKSYPLSVLCEYRFGPLGTGSVVVPANTSWAVAGRIVLRRIDTGPAGTRSIELVAGATFTALVKRLTGTLSVAGSAFTAIPGSSIASGSFWLGGGSTGGLTIAADVPMMANPEKFGDTGSLVTGETGITGLQYSKMDSGRIFVRFTDEGSGNYSAQVYQHAGGTGLLAHTGQFTVSQIGNIVLTSDGSSGVGGMIQINAANISANIGEEVAIQMYPVMQGVCSFEASSTTG